VRLSERSDEGAKRVAHRRPQGADPSEVEATRRPLQYERLTGSACRDSRTSDLITTPRVERLELSFSA